MTPTFNKAMHGNQLRSTTMCFAALSLSHVCSTPCWSRDCGVIDSKKMTSFSETYNSEVVWTLTFFKKNNDDFVSEITIPFKDDTEVRQILGYKKYESLVDKHPINKNSSDRIYEKFNIECDVITYDVFLGAAAVEK
nr:hypothetical protein [uncultured Desulfuromonas sp.]